MAVLLGVAPWHTAVISSALLVLEVDVEENGENHRVGRAYDLVHLFGAMGDFLEEGAPSRADATWHGSSMRETLVARPEPEPAAADLGAEWPDFSLTQLAAFGIRDSRCRRRRLWDQ